MSKPTLAPLSDPMTIALLLCGAVKLPPGDERNANALALERYLRVRASMHGDPHRLAALARALSPEFDTLSTDIFEAALHLFVRGDRKVVSLAPERLRGLTSEQIVTYILTWNMPRGRALKQKVKTKHVAKKKAAPRLTHRGR